MRYSAEALLAMRRRGESKSDWLRAADMTEAEIEAAIAADPEEAGMIVDWSRAFTEVPQSKAVCNKGDD